MAVKVRWISTHNTCKILSKHLRFIGKWLYLSAGKNLAKRATEPPEEARKLMHAC